MKWLISNRMRGIMVVLAAALALAACSSVRMGYTTLPTITWWWLDRYADFSDEQEPLVRDHIAAVYTWHRRQELPRVIDLLFRMEQMARGEVSAQQACGVVADAQLRLKAVAQRAEPAIVSVARGLHPRQLQHLARKYRDNAQRFQKEWLALPRPQQQLKRFEQMADRMEMLYGTLEEPQRAVLQQRIAASIWDPQRLHAEWQRRRQEQLQVLGRVAHEGTSPEEAGALVRGWLERLEQPADPAYRAYRQALLQENCETFAAVHQSTTPAQREQAARQLRNWQRDLRDFLIAQ